MFVCVTNSCVKSSVIRSVTHQCVWECHELVCLGVSRTSVFGSFTTSCVWECHELVCLGMSKDQECHEPVYFEMSGVHRVIQDKDVW